MSRHELERLLGIRAREPDGAKDVLDVADSSLDDGSNACPSSDGKELFDRSGVPCLELLHARTERIAPFSRESHELNERVGHSRHCGQNDRFPITSLTVENRGDV